LCFLIRFAVAGVTDEGEITNLKSEMLVE